MRFALLLLVLGAVTLSANAFNLDCYNCTSCSETFDRNKSRVFSGCNACAKYKYTGTGTVDRFCASYCNPGIDRYGNEVYCCSTDLCNFGERLGSLFWLLLLPAAAVAAISSRL
ncbi:hypothetical protein BOX15_Mlig012092g1 [Macrostomum lignano]|uniref:UPAR/Ly6 domain-containing protein n=2 Tax=Macrostomum lignano TaxID=282301 RepID=A0A1I8GNL6_9PLAT|nr:hypothetical protein BOX15_Mlig012092g1 [Macrostomum lignano]